MGCGHNENKEIVSQGGCLFCDFLPSLDERACRSLYYMGSSEEYLQ
jgi:hypothetical protein